jgi:hypothetical protein
MAMNERQTLSSFDPGSAIARNKAIGRTITPDRNTTPPHEFSDALRVLISAATGERVELAAIVQFTGRRCIGVLLLILALPMVVPIPAAGISVLVGIPLTLLSAQLALARQQMWLPDRLARVSVKRANLLAVIEAALPILRRLEWLVRPRLLCMTGEWVVIPVGLICTTLSLIITLPIPLGHLLPGLAICFFALGLLERDGLVLGLGLIASVVAFAVAAVATHGLVRGIIG